VDVDEREWTGKVLGGRYRITSLLGTGGMGSVWEAEQLDLRRIVAVKILHEAFASDAAIIARFRQEAEATAAIGHPGITQVIEFSASVKEGELPFIVMERLRGTSFRDILRRTPKLPPARVAFITSQVLSALSAAHERHIVHRDIKPGNIFICEGTTMGDFVKVLDFGVAKLLTGSRSLSASGAFVGTLDFMPPEQAEGKKVDRRADIYAVGVCMYVALSGRKPYGDKRADETLRAILESEPPSLARRCPELDPRLTRVVARAMDRDPEARWQTAREFEEALLPWAGAPVRTWVTFADEVSTLENVPLSKTRAARDDTEPMGVDLTPTAIPRVRRPDPLPPPPSSAPPTRADPGPFPPVSTPRTPPLAQRRPSMPPTSAFEMETTEIASIRPSTPSPPPPTPPPPPPPPPPTASRSPIAPHPAAGSAPDTLPVTVQMAAIPRATPSAPRSVPPSPPVGPPVRASVPPPALSPARDRPIPWSALLVSLGLVALAAIAGSGVVLALTHRPPPRGTAGPQ
jgi:serine/threonine-protein kinase